MKAIQLPISLDKLNHELRTLITAILGISSLLSKPELSFEQKIYLNDLHIHSHTLWRLAKKLSSLAKEIEIQPASNDEDSTSLPRTLLVEDTPILQIVYKKMLEKIGLDVDVAGSAEEALHKLATTTYELIITDICLPGINGIELTKRIRCNSAEKNSIPIIALTALSDQNTKQDCLEAGINKVATKPISQENLLELVACYCPMIASV